MATTDVLTLEEARQAVNVGGTTQFDAELQARVTSVSQRLDELVGPVVQRSITGEQHHGGWGEVFLRFYPVSTVSSVTEYDGTTERVLTAETNTTKPTDGYLVGRYGPDPSLMSQRIYRRRNGSPERFAEGALNVVADYTAGRFADTASVAERYKIAASLMLQNLWRSQQSSAGEVGEFEVPQASFPTFAVPRAVREMLQGEIQQPRPKVG
ncbi:hypothetical protein SAMN04487905_10625 [Actinopolyspora xinjiangensis]|uniref:Phage gp6-like head-tail connector protein n=1 Tax=Actinopolyspora xinjiangensis TaxID=405564 RepID=A0A1H0U3C3_9ACTN|nr:hypothetical protein [Actinopolyspora xinjiangensis]SDP60757.1 hypothetical protein SAMN04487905_10625 [Actinopolyspora xinjiangensis]